MLKRFMLIFALGASVATVLHAQERESFEVATIRKAAGNSEDGSWSAPNLGIFKAHNLSLAWLIGLVYGINNDQLVNQPGWLASDKFDLEAKPYGDVRLSREELRPRLQALLRERFHLATHMEQRELPGFELVAAKSGPHLQPTKGAAFPNFRVAVNDHQMIGKSWSMAFLAQQLQKPAGRPVVDRTGIAGSYDLSLEFAPSNEAASSSPSIFTAVQEQLGLQLKARKVPVEVVVIDQVEREPTPN